MEVDFPRGKVDKKKQQNVPRKPVRRKREKNLFMTERSKPKAKKRKVVKSEDNDGKKRKIEGSVDAHGAVKIELLNKKTVCPGMLLLGCISEIRDYKLIISLANNMKGVVSITDVSDTYTSKLQQLAEEEITEEEGVHSLNEMFKVGMLVCCKVSETRLKVTKQILDLSMNPKHVHENKTAKFLKNNMIICGSVVSQEDHGYIIDIGVPNTKGFLLNKNAEEYIQNMDDGESLMEGQVLWFCVKLKADEDLSTDSLHTVHLTISPTKISKTHINVDQPMTFNNLMPGVCATAIVKKASEYGLVVRIGNKICVIHPTHINGNPTDYKEDQEISVSVLYIQPETKSVYLTMLPHLLNYNGMVTDIMLDKLGLGDIIDNAVVCEANKKGVYVKLPHALTGLAQKGNLSDSKVQKIEEEFPIGSKHRCRVVGFNSIDNFVMVSMKKSIIDVPFIKIRDIVPGSIYKVEVKFVKDTVIVVKLGNLKGLIPALHMADIPLKNPSKKFTEGDELECRVLSVDIKDNKVVLTNKKSLVDTKLPTVHDNSQIRKHLELDGFIVMINNRGVLVAFYNNIKGWVPLSELSEEKIEHPEKVFYLGQVVRCRVKNYDEETNKIVLSFRKGPRQKDRKLKEKDTSVPDDFEAGKIVECKVKSKKQELMIVSVTSTGKDAILYKAHLADFDDLCDVLWEGLQEGDILERVVHFKCTNKIIVSMKPSLLKQTENDIIPTDFTELSKDMILPAVVKNIVEYGIFFTLTGGLRGLIPMKVASDNYLPYEEITNYIHVGQSIVVRITHLDPDKRTFVGSMLTRHCFPRSSDKAAILMKLYLENKEMVTNVLSAGQSMGGLLLKMKEIPVGSVVTAIVNDINTDGVSCNMSNGLSAFINNDMLYDIKPVIGDKVLGVVLSIDLIKQRIDLSLDQTIVAAMKNSETEDQIQQLNVDENIPAEVLQVNSHYYMVSLRGKALGSMAYVPTKHTINCINELDLYPVKQNIHVKIHSVYNENLIALTPLHQIKSPTPNNSKNKKNKLYLSIGGVYKAKVKEIHPIIMNLDIEGKPGRVHCTDMVDTIQNGHHPFSDYQVGKEIMVRITGHSKIKKKEEKVAECTARPSQLKGRLEKSSRSFPLKSSRRVFIDKIDKDNVMVNISSQRKGIISIFDISDDLMILENLKSHFKKGQGYNGEVVGCRGRSKIVFTFTGRREKVSEGETTKCYITDIDTESKEIKLLLPARHTAVVKLSSDIKKYHKGQWLWCQVTSVDDTENKCSVTLKKSRGWKTDK